MSSQAMPIRVIVKIRPDQCESSESRFQINDSKTEVGFF